MSLFVLHGHFQMFFQHDSHALIVGAIHIPVTIQVVHQLTWPVGKWLSSYLKVGLTVKFSAVRESSFTVWLLHEVRKDHFRIFPCDGFNDKAHCKIRGPFWRIGCAYSIKVKSAEILLVVLNYNPQSSTMECIKFLLVFVVIVSIKPHTTSIIDCGIELCENI